eukprot:jgi/Psemu1/28073/gm1.28073_g
MARSEEAILRRALKRQRTADRIDMKRQESKLNRKEKLPRSGNHYSPDPRQNRHDGTKHRCVSKPAAAATTTTTTTTTASRNHSDPTNAIETKPVGGTDETTGSAPASAARSETNNANATADDPMKEPGAWICPKCQNSNFASRRYCNSKTCDQVRPFSDANTNADAKPYARTKPMTRPNHPRPPHRNTKPPRSTEKKPPKTTRHDPETSKELVWAKQADSTALSKNQELRRMYRETGGEGMDPSDLERAKLLIARDERKRGKKKKGRKSIETAPEDTTGATSSANGDASIAATAAAATSDTKETPTTSSPLPATTTTTTTADPTVGVERNQEGESSPVPSKKRTKEKSSQAQAKRDQNKALRKLYAETGGKGMKPELIERAKALIARDEKRQKRRAQQQVAASHSGTIECWTSQRFNVNESTTAGFATPLKGNELELGPWKLLVGRSRSRNGGIEIVVW